MNLDEIKKVIPADWLDQHRQEYVELAEKITRTIMMAEAANKGWQKPLTDMADFEPFIASEARDKEVSEEKIRQFLMDAGKIKARNNLFEKYYVPLLPTDDEGKCLVSKKQVLDFIRYTVEGE